MADIVFRDTDPDKFRKQLAAEVAVGRLAESPINSTEREHIIAKLIDCAKAKGLHLTTGSAIQEGRSDEV